MPAPSESCADEAGWIARFVRDGDRAAFAALVRLHQAPLRAFLSRLCADAAQADDLAQETFLKAFRHLPTLRQHERLKAWLFRIAHQEFVSLRRARGQWHDVAIDVEAELHDVDDAHDDASRIEHQIDAALLRNRIAQLPTMQRSALELHYGADLSQSEIAAALNLPLGTVKTLIRRGRLQLQVSCGQPQTEHADD